MSESIPMFIQLTEVSSTDGRPIGPVLVNVASISRIVAPSDRRPVRYTVVLMKDGVLPVHTDAPFDDLVKHLSAVAIPAVPVQPRIHVADLGPDTLVGIRPCDDGEEGWVVLQCVEEVDPSDMVVIKPIGDEHGEIVYVDINDAAEVLRTGHVWKHDMGEGEPDAPDEADGPDTTPAGQEG